MSGVQLGLLDCDDCLCLCVVHVICCPREGIRNSPAPLLISSSQFFPLCQQVVKGPPFIYVTTHGNDNIFKYSRDGSLITDKVLKHAKKAGLGGMR